MPDNEIEYVDSEWDGIIETAVPPSPELKAQVEKILGRSLYDPNNGPIKKAPVIPGASKEGL